MIKEALHKVINNEDLTYEEALETMKEIMTGECFSDSDGSVFDGTSYER